MSLPPRRPLPSYLLLHSFRGQKTGIYFAESSSWPSATMHGSTQQGLPRAGQAWPSTMGWFSGFKLHLPSNYKGQIVAFKITDGSRDDRQPLAALAAALQGKILLYRLSVKVLLERLWQRGLHLVTGAAT